MALVLILTLPFWAETTAELPRTHPGPSRMPPEEELNRTQQPLSGVNCPEQPYLRPHPMHLLPLHQEQYLSSAPGLQSLLELRGR